MYHLIHEINRFQYILYVLLFIIVFEISLYVALLYFKCQILLMSEYASQGIYINRLYIF